MAGGKNDRPRSGWTFGELVNWHFFDYGTRPNGDPARLTGERWTGGEVRKKLHIGPRQIRNWKANRNLPTLPKYTELEFVLFGNERQFDAWKAELRAAYNAARNTKRQPKGVIASVKNLFKRDANVSEPVGDLIADSTVRAVGTGHGDQLSDLQKLFDNVRQKHSLVSRLAASLRSGLPIPIGARSPSRLATEDVNIDAVDESSHDLVVYRPRTGQAQGSETIDLVPVVLPKRKPPRHQRPWLVLALLPALVIVAGTSLFQFQRLADSARERMSEAEVRLDQARREAEAAKRGEDANNARMEELAQLKKDQDNALAAERKQTEAQNKQEQERLKQERERLVKEEDDQKRLAALAATEAKLKTEREAARRAADEARQRQVDENQKKANDDAVRALREKNAAAAAVTTERSNSQLPFDIFDGVAYNGRSVGKTEAATLADCAASCLNHPQCRFFSYYNVPGGLAAKGRGCYRFESLVESPKPNRSYVSGRRSLRRTSTAGWPSTEPVLSTDQAFIRCDSEPRMTLGGFVFECEQTLEGKALTGKQTHWEVADIGECARICTVRTCDGFNYLRSETLGRHSCDLIESIERISTIASSGRVTGLSSGIIDSCKKNGPSAYRVCPYLR